MPKMPSGSQLKPCIITVSNFYIVSYVNKKYQCSKIKIRAPWYFPSNQIHNSTVLSTV